MKLNTELSHEAEYIGDVQENRVGIDRSNIDFITTLLTSNLYSHPLESFLRETVANAYDSHIEAGTKEHILLLIEDTGGYCEYRISIRDYGVGVSPERFDKIYKNVGSSTKRDSNDYIGMFGIGRFSCLSCADVADITSYYNGKKYSYLMYKNGGGINIDKISEVEGDFKNGLEVSIVKTIYTLSELTDSINKLCLFEPLYVSYKGDSSTLRYSIDHFNKRKVVHYNNFSTCSLLEHSYRKYFKVGNILYDRATASSIDAIINLPIGSVDITPNRENLQYTDYTNKKIELQIKAARQELNEILKNSIKGDISLQRFCNLFLYGGEFVETNDDGDGVFIHSEDIDIPLDNFTIDGEEIPEDYIRFMENSDLYELGAEYIHKKINTRGTYLSLKNLLLGRYVLVDKKDKVTKQITLEYLKENLKKPALILVYEGYTNIKESWRKYCHIYKSIVGDKIDECVEFTFRHLPVIEMSNDAVPKEYIESHKTNKTRVSKANPNEVPIRIYYSYGYRVGDLRHMGSHKLIIYSQHTKEDTTLKEIAGITSSRIGVAGVITVKAEHLSLFKNNRRFIELKEFMYMKNKIVSKLVTAKVIRDRMVGLPETPISAQFRNKYGGYIDILRITSYNSTFSFLVDYYKRKNWINECDVNYYTLNERELKVQQEWDNLFKRKYDIIQMMIYKKYGRLHKIGLVPTKIPKFE